MKKMMNFLSAAATIVLASALAACSGDALVNEEAPVKEQEKVSLTVTATQGSRTPDTRLVYTDPNDNKTIDVQWSESETLGVVSYEGDNADDNEYLTSTLDAPAASATFTGDVTPSSNGEYNFYYPTSGSDLTKSGNTVTMEVANEYGGLNYSGDNLQDLSAYNLMYTEQAADPSEGITLKHAFALLRFKLTLPPEADLSKAGSLHISTWKPVFATSATVTYGADGKATVSYAGETSMLSLNMMRPSIVDNTLTAYMLVPAVDNFTGQLCKVSVMDDNQNGYSYVYNLTGNTDPDAAAGHLAAQKVYTFTATLKEDKWASSNVYWMSTASGGYSFFDYPYTIGGAAYQGLFYKWGSTIGISPVGEWVNGGTDNPTKLYDTPNGFKTDYTWSDITPYNLAGGALSGATYDICAGSSGWRMPTRGEWAALMALPNVSIGGSSGITTTAEDGTGAIYQGTLYDNLVFLPNAGERAADSGELYNVGEDFYSWSNEAASAADAYDHGGVSGSKNWAYPIRCIKAN